MSSSGESSAAMISLKNKMQAIREQVDMYRDKYETAQQELQEERARRTEVQENIANLKQHASSLENEIEQQNSELDCVTQKLEQMSKVADDLDRARRALEHRKNMDEDRIAVLEDLVKEANNAVMETERRYDEMVHKLMMAEADVERTEAKATASDERVKALETEMLALCNKIKAIQSIDEKNAEREERYESSIADIKIRLNNAQRSNELADETVANLQQQITYLQEEVQKTNRQNQALHSSLELHAI